VTRPIRLAAALAAATLTTLVVAGPALADALDPAATALKTQHVYSGDPSALDSAGVAELTAAIGSDPTYVAVLPDTHTDYDAVPKTLADRSGQRGVFGVVDGHHFRAGASSGVRNRLSAAAEAR